MTDKFIYNMTQLLETNTNMSLKVLLEKDEESTDDNAGADSDSFDAFDETESESEGEDETEGEGESEGEDETESEGESGTAEETIIDTLTKLRQNLDQTDIMANDESELADEFKVKPEKIITLNAPSTVANASIKAESIKKFVILEEEEREDIESILNDYQDQIDSMEIQSYKNLKSKEHGALVDVPLEVESALNYITNFDSIFKKSEIVYDWFVDKISSVAAANKKEEVLKKFKDELNKRLPDEDKIDIQEKPSSYNPMAGAKPPA